MAKDVRRELQNQLTVMSTVSQWVLFPVISLCLWGLWTELAIKSLLIWAAVAYISAIISIVNNRINVRQLSSTEAADDSFIERNIRNYFLMGLSWGGLPLVCALGGSIQANWISMVTTMAIMSGLLQILSTTHRVFYAAYIPISCLTLLGITLGPLPQVQMLLLAAIYFAVLFFLHRVLFKVHAERVRSALRYASHAAALARTLEHRDSLTGLANRAGLEDWLQRNMLENPDETTINVAVGIVPGFTELNSLYGATIADSLLTEIANKLIEDSKGKIGIARFNGAEFILADLKPLADIDELTSLFAALEHTSFAVVDQTFTINLRQSSVKGKPNELFKLIDVARGRLQADRIETGGNEALNKLSHEARRNLVSSFHDALWDKQIQPWFQPIVDCNTNAIIGWEALARWEHPKLGILLPEIFLDIARVSRQLMLLTQIMLRTSAQFAKDLSRLGLHQAAQVNVNMTISELGNADTLSWLERIIAETGVKPSQIVIELSERDALIVDSQLQKNLLRMGEIGMLLSIDDFGTGYSNLGHLLDLPAHSVKLDKRFIERLPYDKKSAALVRAVITLASGLGMTAVAEGVEHDEQLHFLRQHGCTAYQGYRAGMAMPYTVAIDIATKWQGTVPPNPPTPVQQDLLPH
jgi:EAL domain-containing protein (putative c-di-GMP-specific phosphodiesterase class I)/GGDEF domain-containing protein